MTNNPIKKMINDLNRHFTIEALRVGEKLTKALSTLCLLEKCKLQ